MYRNINNNIFDCFLQLAFNDYVEMEFAEFPSKEYLDKKYPIPKKHVRRSLRKLKEKQYNRPLFIIYSQRIFAAILIATSISFVFLLSSAEVRAAVKDTVIEWFDKYIRFDFDNSDIVDKDKSIHDFNIGYIPEGFELTSHDEGDNYIRKIYYSSQTDDYLVIELLNSDISIIMSDIEYQEYSEITINSQTAYLLYSDADHSGTIIFGNLTYAITVQGALDKEDLIKIAQKIN